MIKVNAHTLNHLSGDANINVIATLEDNFGKAFELEFDFNDDTQTEQEETEQVAEGGETANG